MEKIRVSKVDNVVCWRQGKRFEGTLHLTAHHVIFNYAPPAASDSVPKAKARELWITYPMIAFCTYRPAPPASHQAPSIRLRCRDFVFVAFNFLTEKEASAVYNSIKSLTCKLGRIEKLYAFSYVPQPPEKDLDGWNIFDYKKEFARQGVTKEAGWRITNINADYVYSPTYPAILAVPNSISDNVLKYAGNFRSRARIPALTYLHPINNCTITRSSQPLVGFRGNRSIQDEKLVAAICDTTKASTKALRSTSATPMTSRSASDLTTELEKSEPEPSSLEDSFIDAESIEDEAIKAVSDRASSDEAGTASPRVYGAQQRNIIIDARPTVNAIANRAQGKGSEDMDYYRCATKAYLGIDNIHVMRKSLIDVVEALKDADITPFPPNREQLSKSGWLKHIANLLDGAALIARTVGIYHSHVLVHCSDGWDRTSQLSALGQLCLDPYYRTLEGFIVLIEKDWLSFGHMFRQRSGYLGSEKWFEVENERIGGNRSASNGAPASATASNAFETGVNRLKGFFNQSNASHDSFTDDDSDAAPQDSPAALAKRSSAKAAPDDKLVTKVKETSPVFHQFLDATYQLLRQHPTRFEFNERFLRRLLYHLYSCQYGTFLYDSEKERADARARARTRSVWDYFLARRAQFVNEAFDAAVDDTVPGRERIVFPRKDDVRWWAEVFGRADAEMNGPPPSAADALSEMRERADFEAPVLTAVEAAGETRSVGAAARLERGVDDGPSSLAASPMRGGTPRSQSPAERLGPLAQGASETLSAGLAAMGLGSGSGGLGRAKSPRGVKEQEMMEVEMR